MSVCPSCGNSVYGEAEVCTWHHADTDDWAKANRIMCDFFHRQKKPKRLPIGDRIDTQIVDPTNVTEMY